ncbi:MAG TPA: amino acid ABC transporter permease [Clostridiales bacterium]|uniref:Amino acid ABC transporter permease n=2 Tax=Oscillospiraceae TaxID=216572 RepID=A0A926HXM7_9FIRM|nr:amino acid ABC transporter permease [Congzhengia minquanensis]MBD8946085.1 amino acid ABC transporter permease [Clostridiales bacterium]MBD8946279.1 amino acid ABC transporter permease [Clostridiales bacterium]HBL82332.1 amino acid ABC transporter permease [Clostridiales bacterium]
MAWFADFKADFILNFVEKQRWTFITSGLKNTLIITFFSLILGLFLGAVVAIVRSSYDKTYSEMNKGIKKILFSILNGICKIYLTVIRGTPVVVQLMIMYYIIFASSRNSLLVAIIAFGINSGAYVAEIVRSGIMSIDLGQFEAGRSLGFNYRSTMIYIIIPQAFKNVLPALANEFIVLLKETSVAGYVTIRDLTMGGNIIRATTYSPFLPLIAVALIYLVMVMFFTKLVSILERRLRKNER